MATEIFSASEIPSPRISFSRDHITSNEITQYRSDSNSDFNFCVGDISIQTEPCSADELFSNGLIRPLQIQERFVKNVSQNNQKQPVFENIEAKQPPKSKSFWGMKRSTSLHCEKTNKKSSFWSLPLLLRSNSTGSVPSSKPSQKQSSQKQRNPLTSSSSHKPPLKKNYGGHYGNSVRISPVLNVPPPYISRGTSNLFGFGYLFRNGKDKKNKKLS